MTGASASDILASVERRIADGELRPGDRLLPVRQEAERLGVAPNTVAAAYRRLRDRGVVAGRGRQGTVVAARPLIAPVLAEPVPQGVVDAMTGNPDPALLPDLTAALTAAAGERPARYGDVLVDPGLALVARRLFAADGVDATHLTVVSGAMDAVERLLGARLRPGDRVGVEDPGYASVHQLVTGLGFRAVPVRTDDQGMTPESLHHALGSGLDALIVTPRASNPSGAAFTSERTAALIGLLADAPDVFVIEDDHAGPVAGVDFQGLDHDRARWATVRSVAKSLGPDLRLALVAGDRTSIDRVEARLQIGPGWVSHLLQRAVRHLLEDPATRAMIGRAGATYTTRRRRLRDALRDRGLVSHARSGLHCWVPVPDEHTVVMALRERGVAVRSGGAYRLRTPPAVRVTTAALDDDQIDLVARSLAEVLDPAEAASRSA